MQTDLMFAQNNIVILISIQSVIKKTKFEFQMMVPKAFICDKSSLINLKDWMILHE